MFDTARAKNIYQSFLPDLKQALRNLARLDTSKALSVLQPIDKKIAAESAALRIIDSDSLFNDFFILSLIVTTIKNYLKYWELVLGGENSKSWDILQAIQNNLRILFRHTKSTRPQIFKFIEDQCVELEKLYPYSYFTSIGAIVKDVVCCICEKDINSFECTHIRGELYRGKIAYGIVNKIELDHIAIVEHPRDKRTTIVVEDDAPGFAPLRFLSAHLSEKFTPLNFYQAIEGKKMVPNKERPKRNDRCLCGSGRKFKKCCGLKPTIDQDHIRIIPRVISIENLFATS